LDVIDEQVSELVKNNFVEPAASRWASNVVLVRKKDGLHWLCMDYRAVNAVTYKDTYPLPHIDTCLESMDGPFGSALWTSGVVTTTFLSRRRTVIRLPSSLDGAAFVIRFYHSACRQPRVCSSA